MPRPPLVRRSLAGRCFGTLLALWFAISIAEPQWLHACPMHNAPASGDAPAAAHGGHHAGAGHAGHADASVPAPSHDHASAHCLCLGDCAPGAAVTLGSIPELPIATVVVIEPRGVLPRADYVPVVRERTLPFATAPPAL